MLQNEYLDAKIGVDTVENELQKSQRLAFFAEPNRASHWLVCSPGSASCNVSGSIDYEVLNEMHQILLSWCEFRIRAVVE